MPVMIHKSLSVRVQDYINAWLAKNNPTLTMINPATKNAVTTKVTDMPEIGFSTKSHHQAPMGFPEHEPAKEEKEGDRIFEIEAVLLLEFDRQALPADLQKIEGEYWLLGIKEEAMLKVIQPLAEALFEVFQINIVIKIDEEVDEDPKHLDVQPVNPAFPGVVYCPVLPKEI